MKPLLALFVGVLLILPPVRWYVAFGRPERIAGRVSVGNRRIVVRETRTLELPPVPGSPVGFDCNNPVYRDGGRVYCFSSHETPYRSVGSDLNHLENPPRRVSIDNEAEWKQGGRWIESVHKAPNGSLYMWYHNEPPGVIPNRPGRTAPRIGQMVSNDDGLHWHDQGFVLEADPSTFSTTTANNYFGGGVGDFTVVPDREGAYFYFLFSTYPSEVREQGVAIARMAASDLDNPVGKAFKWFDGRWTEPGLGGRATPIFSVEADWHSPEARALWGPSVHWNEHLKEYVVLMNRAAGNGWDQTGVYIAFNGRLDDPQAWTKPTKLMDATEWYPQVVGYDAQGRESDRVAGRVARLFLKGKSNWTLEFE
ncbi:glycoside hydrolase family protein [Paludisphaera rhizosphaerae]|uniref:hypothetical protein n=1 Tax=Paludisphaera rhizosphaerae TaxID=2711216 RepID=UPI0013E9CBD6|nr:hypothetical protein [Paludisphaera rhizosphaerae]